MVKQAGEQVSLTSDVHLKNKLETIIRLFWTHKSHFFIWSKSWHYMIPQTRSKLHSPLAVLPVSRCVCLFHLKHSPPDTHTVLRNSGLGTMTRNLEAVSLLLLQWQCQEHIIVTRESVHVTREHGSLCISFVLAKNWTGALKNTVFSYESALFSLRYRVRSQTSRALANLL